MLCLVGARHDPNGVLRVRQTVGVPERVVGRVGGNVRVDLPGASAVEEHIRYTTDLLVQRSSVIAERVADGRVGVVGLCYQLAEGTVRRVAGHGI